MSNNNDLFAPFRFLTDSQESVANATSMTCSLSSSEHRHYANILLAHQKNNQGFANSQYAFTNNSVANPVHDHFSSQRGIPPTVHQFRTTGDDYHKEEFSFLHIIDGSDDESMMDYRYSCMPTPYMDYQTTIEARLAEATRLENEVIGRPLSYSMNRYSIRMDEKPRSKKMLPIMPQIPAVPMVSYKSDPVNTCPESEFIKRFRDISLASDKQSFQTDFNKQPDVTHKEYQLDKNATVSSLNLTPKNPIVAQNSILDATENSNDHTADREARALGTRQQQGQPLQDTTSVINISMEKVEPEKPSLENFKNTDNCDRSILTKVRISGQGTQPSDFQNNYMGDSNKSREHPNEEHSFSSAEIKSLERSSMDSREIGEFLVPNSSILGVSEKNDEVAQNSVGFQQPEIRTSVLSHVGSNASHPVASLKTSFANSNSDGESINKLGDTKGQVEVLNIPNLEVMNNNEEALRPRKMRKTWRGVRAKMVSSRTSSLLSFNDTRNFGSHTKNKYLETNSTKKPWIRKVHETHQRILRTATRVMFSKIDEFQGMSFDRLSEAAKSFDFKGAEQQSLSISQDTSNSNSECSNSNTQQSIQNTEYVRPAYVYKDASQMNVCSRPLVIPTPAPVVNERLKYQLPNNFQHSSMSDNSTKLSLKYLTCVYPNLTQYRTTLSDSPNFKPQKMYSNSSMPSVWKMKNKQTGTKFNINNHNTSINLVQNIPLQFMGLKQEKSLPDNTHGMYGYL
ncbi:uncharacterized protein Ecym_2173 [Eremothecium cymbalariae DBVPG|uniref:Uncharacterized protein n=1 Tax=Eremothecium cymbalariae (strain CBS 270.75 / DBVPG 7215 / KCTC 17166 / NRRL Y-17582) TaxID=931890 RepID=G8JNK8_ERECY|nr:Hypothetical protein Ecym_2173 [Eremothecium cymbalariae DBVPG\